jgi:hypothetical protein
MASNGTFAYLGQDMMSAALIDFSQMFKTYLPNIVNSNPELQKKLERYESRSNVWQQEVVNTFRNRKSPVFTQESIIRLNQKYIHQIEAINNSRKDKARQIQQSIDRHGDRLIQFQDQLQFLLADRTQDNTHRIASLNTHIVSIEASIISLREQKNAILPVVKSSAERYWVYQEGNMLRGSVPAMQSDQQIENDVLPNESEIMRNISIHPTTQTVNLPLSIKMLIKFADTVGLSDKHLAVILMIFLKKHRTELFYVLQPKKNNIKLLIDAISIECSNKAEIVQIKSELSKFKREVTENFAKTVNRFDAL